MENIIGIKFFDKIKGEGAVITWGNTFKESELLDIVVRALKKNGADDIETIEFCSSLVLVSNFPYFNECLIRFIQEPVPVDKAEYDQWLNRKRNDLKQGYDMYFTGFKSQYEDYLKRKAKGFPDDYE